MSDRRPPPNRPPAPPAPPPPRRTTQADLEEAKGSLEEIASDDPFLLDMLAPKLTQLPRESRDVVIDMLEVTVRHTGNIPLPSIAKGYEQIMPGATDRLFAMAETQVNAIARRMDADIAGEQDERNKNQTYRLVSLLAGAVVCLSLIGVGGAVAILAQSPITGALVSIVGVATGLAGIFVTGRPLMDGSTAKTPEQPPKPPESGAEARTRRQKVRRQR